MSHYKDIVAHIPYGKQVPSTWLHPHGGIVLSPKEGAYLEKLFSTCSGAHIDIGTYFGGSAILAALSKPAGQVYTIDSRLGGHWDQGTISLAMVKTNLAWFGVSDRVSLVKCYSHPWPADVTPAEVESVFIDGDENDESETGGPLWDWKNAKGITTGYIIFHDCRGIYPGVVRTVELAQTDPNWKLIDSVDSIRVFKRNDNS